jgi:hypothetical protein
MSRPGDRFSTTKTEPNTPAAAFKEQLTDFERNVLDLLDPSEPAVTAALQRLEIVLHILAGVPGAHETSSTPVAVLEGKLEEEKAEEPATKPKRASRSKAAKEADAGESGDESPQTE